MYRNKVPVTAKLNNERADWPRRDNIPLSESRRMRSSQRSISKLVRVLQFGPQASASQQALTFDVSVIAEVCDEMFQVRSKSESDRRNRSSCLSGVIGSYPPTRKTCRRPIILTPMSYRSEITPKPSKFAAVTKPAMGDE